MDSNSQFPKKFIFLRSPRFIATGLFTLIVVGAAAAWFLWGRSIREFIKERDVRLLLEESQVSGYVKEGVKEESGEQGAVFTVSDHPIENIERVVDNVSVRVKTFFAIDEP